MSKPPLPEAAVAMLGKPNPTVITTLRQEGQPVSTATRYVWDDGRVLVNMDEGRKRLEHMPDDPGSPSTTATGAPTSASPATARRRVRTPAWPTSTARPGSTRAGRTPQRDRRRISAWIAVDGWCLPQQNPAFVRDEKGGQPALTRSAIGRAC
jgi:hypothetical protein